VALEGLRKYQICLTVGDEESVYDGMAELWFDSVEDMENSFKTELGRQLAEDSTAQGSMRLAIVFEENPIL